MSAWATSTWPRPSRHIWFFKGVPRRIGYLLDMAPKELEKVLYFAASIVTWVDDEARRPTSPKLEKEVTKVLDAYAAEKEERVLELQRVARPPRGLPPDRQAAGLHRGGPPVGRLARRQRQEAHRRRPREAPEGHPQDVRRGLSDTEAYIEDAAERMRQVWDLFQNDEAQGHRRGRDASSVS